MKNRSVFSAHMWALFMLILITGYTAGFVIGSIAVETGIKRTVTFLEGRKR